MGVTRVGGVVTFEALPTIDSAIESCDPVEMTFLLANSSSNCVMSSGNVTCGMSLHTNTLTHNTHFNRYLTDNYLIKVYFMTSYKTTLK